MSVQVQEWHVIVTHTPPYLAPHADVMAYDGHRQNKAANYFRDEQFSMYSISSVSKPKSLITSA